MLRAFAIKVGNKSSLKISGVNTYRAITINELDELMNSDLGIDTVIIEQIYEDEYAEAEKLVSKLKDNGTKVLFYTPNNDENTTGLADSLIMDIYLNEEDLYNAIEINCGIDVRQCLKEASNCNSLESGFDSLDGLSNIGIEPESSTSEKNKSNTIDKNESALENNNTEAELKDDTNEIPEKIEDSTVEDSNIASDVNTEQNSENTKHFYELIKSLEDERDSYKNELKRIAKLEILENPITVNEYNQLKDKLNKFGESTPNDLKDAFDKIKCHETTISELNVQIEGLNNKIESLNSEIDAYKGKNEKIEELNKQIAELEKEKELAIEKGNNLENIKNNLDNEVISLNNKINELQEGIESKSDNVCNEYGITKLGNTIMIAASIVMNLNNEIEAAKQSEEEAIENLNKTIDKLNETDEKLKETQSNLDQKEAELIEADEKLRDSENNLNKAYENIDGLNSQLSDKSDELNRTRNDLSQKESEIDKNENQLKASYSEITAMQNEIADLKKKVNNSEDSSDNPSFNVILANNKTLENVNKSLMDQIEAMRKAVSEVRENEINTRNANSVLKDDNARLAEQVKALSIGFSGGARVGMINAIEYNGRAQIINVFGSGSFGITTTAMSIANYLSNTSRVVYIDFDLMSAKADGWFRINPIVSIPEHRMTSSLALMITDGVDCIIENSDTTIQTARETKGGVIKYIGGMYENIDVVKLTSADYARLLNYLAYDFDYIIIDFGKLNASEINDQMIKTFCDIARGNIVVTSNDNIDIRNARIFMQKAKIKFDNTAWLVNLCAETKMDDNCKKNIYPMNYKMMPFLDEFYGQKLDFTKNKFSRDRLIDFFEKDVLKK